MYWVCKLLFVEKTHTIPDICVSVFHKSEMHFDTEMADLINYGAVAVSGSAVILVSI